MRRWDDDYGYPRREEPLRPIVLALLAGAVLWVGLYAAMLGVVWVATRLNAL